MSAHFAESDPSVRPSTAQMAVAPPDVRCCMSASVAFCAMLDQGFVAEVEQLYRAVTGSASPGHSGGGLSSGLAVFGG